MSRAFGLKSACRQSLGWLSTPGCRSVTGNGLDKPNRENAMNTHVRLPGAPKEAALYIRTPVTPDEAFQAIGRLRKEARDEIDRLIQFLDKIDDYVSRELEDSIDDHPHDGDALEPSLCGVTVDAVGPGSHWHGEVDLEGDDTANGRSAEDEPNLGSVAVLDSQEAWAAGGRHDLEGDEHDGREPDVDDEEGADAEPKFGWNDEEAAPGRYPSLMGSQVPS